jgi:hypothetical protein
MKTLLLAFLVASTSLSAQTLWDKAQYGASHATLMSQYPEAQRSDYRGATDPTGNDLTFNREIGKYRYAVTLHMEGDALRSVSMRPLAYPTPDMYLDMNYSIIAKYGGPNSRGDEMNSITWWTIEDKQVSAQVQFSTVNGLPWSVMLSTRYALAKDLPPPVGEGC